MPVAASSAPAAPASRIGQRRAFRVSYRLYDAAPGVDPATARAYHCKAGFEGWCAARYDFRRESRRRARYPLSSGNLESMNDYSLINWAWWVFASPNNSTTAPFAVCHGVHGSVLPATANQTPAYRQNGRREHRAAVAGFQGLGLPELIRGRQPAAGHADVGTGTHTQRALCPHQAGRQRGLMVAGSATGSKGSRKQ